MNEEVTWKATSPLGIQAGLMRDLVFFKWRYVVFVHVKIEKVKGSDGYIFFIGIVAMQFWYTIFLKFDF